MTKRKEGKKKGKDKEKSKWQRREGKKAFMVWDPTKILPKSLRLLFTICVSDRCCSLCLSFKSSKPQHQQRVSEACLHSSLLCVLQPSTGPRNAEAANENKDIGKCGPGLGVGKHPISVGSPGWEPTGWHLLNIRVDQMPWLSAETIFCSQIENCCWTSVLVPWKWYWTPRNFS